MRTFTPKYRALQQRSVFINLQLENKNMIQLSDYTNFLGLSTLQKGLSLSPLKLQKLLYYEQAWSMVFFGREQTLFAEAPQAWVNGPVYPSVYHTYSQMLGVYDEFSKEHFCNLQEVGKPTDELLSALAVKMNLSEDQLALSDRILTLYGTKSQDELVLMTHCEEPWCEQREGLLPFERSDRELSFDTMYRYYKARHDFNRSRRAHV